MNNVKALCEIWGWGTSKSKRNHFRESLHFGKFEASTGKSECRLYISVISNHVLRYGKISAEKSLCKLRTESSAENAKISVPSYTPLSNVGQRPTYRL